MNDVQYLFSSIRREAKLEAERELLEIERKLPRLLVGDHVFARPEPPKYTNEQRETYVARRQQQAIDRLVNHLVKVAIEKTES